MKCVQRSIFLQCCKKLVFFRIGGPSLGIHCLELSFIGALCFAFYSYSLSGFPGNSAWKPFPSGHCSYPPPQYQHINPASSSFKNAMFLGVDKNIICSGISLTYPAPQGSGQQPATMWPTEKPVSCFAKSVVREQPATLLPLASALSPKHGVPNCQCSSRAPCFSM